MGYHWKSPLTGLILDVPFSDHSLNSQCSAIPSCVLGVGGSHREDITTVDPQSGPGQLETPHPSPVLRMYILPTVPTVGAGFKDMVLREHVFWDQLKPVKASV